MRETIIPSFIPLHQTLLSFLQEKFSPPSSHKLMQDNTLSIVHKQLKDLIIKLASTGGIIHQNCQISTLLKICGTNLKTAIIQLHRDVTSTHSVSTADMIPVDLRMSIVKLLSAKWIIGMYDHFKASPQTICNGFRAAGL